MAGAGPRCSLGSQRTQSSAGPSGHRRRGVELTLQPGCPRTPQHPLLHQRWEVTLTSQPRTGDWLVLTSNQIHFPFPAPGSPREHGAECGPRSDGADCPRGEGPGQTRRGAFATVRSHQRPGPRRAGWAAQPRERGLQRVLLSQRLHRHAVGGLGPGPGCCSPGGWADARLTPACPLCPLPGWPGG